MRKTYMLFSALVFLAVIVIIPVYSLATQPRMDIESEIAAVSATAPVQINTDPASLPELMSAPEPEPEILPDVYIQEEGLTPEQVIEAYFEQQYLSYVNNRYIDISSIVDTSLSRMSNTLAWLELLIQRRRLLDEYGICYVETRKLPYEIIYLDEEEISDDRVAFWQSRGISYDDEIMLHFTIKGDPGEAYPPMMAMNSQHSVRMRKDDDGMWKISFHYYPGSIRKFRWLEPLEIPDDEDALQSIFEEFGIDDSADSDITPDAGDILSDAVPYDGALAAQYARFYTETPNPDFYHIGDWMGNCANFTSQCIWYGFGGADSPASGVNMSNTWYAGSGGGSPAWENVSYFWDYATSGKELNGYELENAGRLITGDLIQTHSGVIMEDEDEVRFNHSLVVVDGNTLMLAQNSPGAFVYYCDLVNVETRIFRPVSMLE